MADVASIFSKRLHPFLYAALRSGEHSEYNPRALFEEEKRNNGKKVRRLPQVREFQTVLEEVLWTILVQDGCSLSSAAGTPINSSIPQCEQEETHVVGPNATSLDSNAAPPLRLTYSSFNRCMQCWLEKVVGVADSNANTTKSASQSDKEPTEILFVQLCTSILLYTTRYRHSASASPKEGGASSNENPLQSSTPVKPDTSLPPGVVAVAKAIPAAILSLRRRCVYKKNEPEGDDASNSTGDNNLGRLDVSSQKQEVKQFLKLLWFHFLFIFSQQLMTVFSTPDNDAWTQFCVSCLSDARASQNFFSTSFSDDEESDADEEEDEEAARETLEALKQSPAVPSPLPKPGEPLVLVEETQKNCLLHREAVEAWGNDLPPKFFSDALSKARSRRVVLLSRSCVPHHLMQSPDATLSLVQLLEGFVQEWNSTLEKLPIGFLSSSSRRRKYFPYFEEDNVATEQLGDARDALRRIPVGTQNLKNEGEAAFNSSLKKEEQPTKESSQSSREEASIIHFQTLEYLASLPHQYAKKISKLVGDARMHAYLLVSVIVSVLMTQYILPQRSYFMPTTLAPPGKNASLMDMVRWREKAVLWIHRGQREYDARVVAGQSTGEPPVDELEWQWRHYCPLGMLFSSSSPFPVQSFLMPHLAHIVTSAYRIGPTPTARMEARQRIVMAGLLCGIIDVPKALLLYHLAVKPSTASPVTAAGGNAAAANNNSAATASNGALPTTALRGYTSALNSAVRAAETQMIIETTSSNMMHAPPSYLSATPQSSSYSNVRSRGNMLASRPTENLSVDDEDDERLDEDEEEEELLIDGQLQGKRFHEMVYPVPIPSPSQWLTVENASTATSSSSTPLTSLVAGAKTGNNNNADAAESLENPLSLISFVLDFLLSRYTNIAAQAINYLQHHLALPLKAAASLPTAGSSDGNPIHEAMAKTLSLFGPISSSIDIPHTVNPKAAATTPSGGGGSSSANAADVPMPVNVFLVPRTLLPAGVTIQSAILVLLEEQLVEWDRQEAVVLQHHNTTQGHAFSLEGWWIACGQHQLCGLQSLAPLLAEANSFLADQTVLSRLLQRLETFCRRVWRFAYSKMMRSKSDMVQDCSGMMNVVRHALGLSEYIVIHLVMPCMRMLAPSPAVYDELFRLMQTWEGMARSGATLYGEQHAEFLHITEWSRQENLVRCRLVGEYAEFPSGNADGRTAKGNHSAEDSSSPSQLVLPSRHPYDYLRCKEQQALFQQSMKRINMKNTRFYSRLLTPVFYSQPLFTVEKLLQQAVGYKNNFLDVHQRLLMGVPAAFVVLLLHRGLDALASYAAEEQTVGSDLLRTTNTARFLAVMARSQHKDRRLPLRLLMRSVEHALRRYTRSDHIYALELLKAVLYECVGAGLSHEEQYSPIQRAALVSGGAVTSFFASGRGDSFLRNRWMSTSRYSPLELYETKLALLDVLAEPCPVPLAASLDNSNANNENEETMSGAVPLLDVWDMEEKELCEVPWRGEAISLEPSVKKESNEEEDGTTEKRRNDMGYSTSHRESVANLGQQMLLHLCQRHASLSRLQADLEGTTEAVLLTNAKEMDTLVDLIFVMEGLLQEYHQVQQYEVHRMTALGQQTNSNSTGIPLPPHYGAPNDLLEDASIPLLALRLRCDAEPQRSLLSSPPCLSGLTTFFKHSTTQQTNDEEGEALDLLQDQLSFFIAGHLSFEPSCYQAAEAEIKAYHQFWCKRYKKSAQLYLDRNASATPTSNNNNHNNSIGACTEADHSFCPPVFSVTTPSTPSDQEEAFLEWCRRRVRREESVHRQMYQESEAARQHLVRLFRSVLVDSESKVKVDPVLIATDVLVPRLLLSTPDAVFVEHLVRLLWKESASGASPSGVSPFRDAVIAMIFSMVSAYFSFFVGFTSSECRRIGYFLATVVELLRSDMAGSSATSAAGRENEREKLERGVEQFVTTLLARSTSSSNASPSSSGAGVSSSSQQTARSPAAAPQALQSSLLSQLLFDRGNHNTPTPTIAARRCPGLGGAAFSAISRLHMHSPATHHTAPSPSNANATRRGAAVEQPAGDVLKSTPCYPIQFHFYISDAISHLLASLDAPPHTQRNALLVLERLPLEVFPSTVACIDLLLSALRPHMDKQNPNSPSAMAAVKRLLTNRTRRKERQTTVGQTLLSQVLSDAAADVSPLIGSSPGALLLDTVGLQRWFALCMAEENYARRLVKEREKSGEVGVEQTEELAEELVRQAAEALAEEEAEKAKQEKQEGDRLPRRDGENEDGENEDGEEEEKQSSGSSVSEDDEDGSFSGSSSESSSHASISGSSDEDESSDGGEEEREPTTTVGSKRTRVSDGKEEAPKKAKSE